jgi:hypothetical protein
MCFPGVRSEAGERWLPTTYLFEAPNIVQVRLVCRLQSKSGLGWESVWSGMPSNVGPVPCHYPGFYRAASAPLLPGVPAPGILVVGHFEKWPS